MRHLFHMTWREYWQTVAETGRWLEDEIAFDDDAVYLLYPRF